MSPRFWLPLLMVCLSFTPATWGQLSEREEGETIRLSGQRPAEQQSLDLSPVGEMIIEQTNQFRREQNLSPVSQNENLQETAQYFADFMARTNKYGHTADGKRPSQRAAEHGYEYCIVSENIAYAYRSTGFIESELAENFVQGWIDSPEHRKNMVEPAVTEIGAAVAHSQESGHYYAVQMFGRPRSASIKFQVVNESGEAVRYRIGERAYSLPPRFSRSHQQCRPSQVSFFSSDAGEEAAPAKTVNPDSGDRFLVRKQQDELQVEETRAEE